MLKVEIIPAILPRNFAELEEKATKAALFVSAIQVDVADGKLIPNKTWPYSGERDILTSIIKEERGLPAWEKLDYEVDLMVANPEKDLNDWILAGAKRFVLHLESEGDMLALLKATKEKYGNSKEGAMSVEVGIALPPGESIEKLFPFIHHPAVEDFGETSADFVQLMGISKIGFQGNPFREEVLGEIRALREKYPKLIISIDGGVSSDTAESLREAGANRLVSGSFLFESSSFDEALHILRG